jgi:hypothetical protein
MGRSRRKETVGENKHWHKEVDVNWEGLFLKFKKLLWHKWNKNWILSLKILFPQQLSHASFTNPVFTVGLLQLLNLWLLKVMLGCINNGVTTTKPGHHTNGNVWVMWPISYSVQQEEFAFAKHTRKPKIRNAWSQSETWGRFCDGLGHNILLVSFLPIMVDCKGVRR